ncbi:hypothetical protein WJX84_004604 [Apatococcus fuscideae]|uniref:NADP-dependent oxidoreductase domain-containing protein n=1 Tax=Apatococcus fuscideae TaxID=2026836 RepID=A0AAW1SJQ5_9CHLO
MTFGENNWQRYGECTRAEAQKLFNRYCDLGGNFLDTANVYQVGQSEEWLGEFIKERGNREDLVLATKYTAPMPPLKTRNSNGMARKNMLQAVDASLKRLQMSFIDLLYVHTWDHSTPPEELMRGLNDLVQQGKVLYLGVSDTPAWQVSRCNALAERHGWSPFVCYQGKHNIGDRDMERDIIPMCREMGLGVAPWSVLGAGKFTGRFKRGEQEKEAGRSNVQMSDNDWAISDVVHEVANEAGATPAQVVLNWSLRAPGITSPIVGSRKVEHLEDTLKGVDLKLSEQQLERLKKAADLKLDLGFPHNMIGQRYEDNFASNPVVFHRYLHKLDA